MIYKLTFNNEGFSLIALLSTILIIGITSSIYISTTKSQRQDRQDLLSLEKLSMLKAAFNEYHGNNGVFPDNINDLFTKPIGLANCAADLTETSPTYRKLQGWCGPYLQIDIAQNSNYYNLDGWGTSFEIDSTYIRSCGFDKTCGNSDDIYEYF